MKPCKILALIGLATTTAGPILAYLGIISIEQNKHLMLGGMLLWFGGATPWLGTSKA